MVTSSACWHRRSDETAKGSNRRHLVVRVAESIFGLTVIGPSRARRRVLSNSSISVDQSVFGWYEAAAL
jgi:hypothetical protein